MLEAAGIPVRIERRFGGRCGLPTEWEITVDFGRLAASDDIDRFVAALQPLDGVEIHTSAKGFVEVRLPQGTPPEVAGDAAARMAGLDAPGFAEACRRAARIAPAAMLVDVGSDGPADRLNQARQLFTLVGLEHLADGLAPATCRASLTEIQTALVADLGYERRTMLGLARDALALYMVVVDHERQT